MAHLYESLFYLTFSNIPLCQNLINVYKTHNNDILSTAFRIITLDMRYLCSSSLQHAEFRPLERNYRRNSPPVQLYGHPVKHKDLGSGCLFLCPPWLPTVVILADILSALCLKTLHCLRLQTNICEEITNVS